MIVEVARADGADAALGDIARIARIDARLIDDVEPLDLRLQLAGACTWSMKPVSTPYVFPWWGEQLSSAVTPHILDAVAQFVGKHHTMPFDVLPLGYVLSAAG